jgi:hypothetical protein
MLTALRCRLRRVTRSAQSGTSLTELLVAMVLMSIFGALTVRLFVTVDQSTRSSTDRAINSASAGAVMQSWAQYLRVADGTTPGSNSNRFEWFTGSDVLFYADLFNRTTSGSGVASTSGATILWLRLDSKGVLIEEQFPSTAVQGAAPAACRRLLNQVTGGGTATLQLFTPYDAGGNDLTGLFVGGKLGTAPTPSSGCQNLPVTPPSQAKKQDPTAAANLPNIARVSIDFSVTDTKKQHGIEFSSVVTLPVLGGAI